MKKAILPFLALGVIVFSGASALKSSTSAGASGCCSSTFQAAPAALPVAAAPVATASGCCPSQSVARQAILASATKDDGCCGSKGDKKTSATVTSNEDLVKALRQLIAAVESGAAVDACASTNAARSAVLAYLAPESGATGCPFLDGCGDKKENCSSSASLTLASMSCATSCESPCGTGAAKSEKASGSCGSKSDCDAPCAKSLGGPIAAAE